MIEIKRNAQKPTQTAQERPQQPASAQAINNTPEAQKRTLQPFTALDGSNYRAAYRAVCDFHERHNPPRLDDDSGEKYWNSVCDDMSETANRFDNDPFIAAMLIAVFEELERQFMQLRTEAGSNDAAGSGENTAAFDRA